MRAILIYTLHIRLEKQQFCVNNMVIVVIVLRLGPNLGLWRNTLIRAFGLVRLCIVK